jgi:hypothetical protein
MFYVSCPFVTYLLTFPRSIEWQNDSCTEKEFEGSGRGLIEGLSRHSSGETEENHETIKSGKLISWSRFESGTSGVKLRSVTA